jgi:adenylate cyclase
MQDPTNAAFSDAVRTHLARVLRAEKFEASERNRRFLKYVVEETLAGRGSRIKAYSIATVALGRSDNFDPQIDPIVRIEAHRLRRALAYYYMTDGKADQIRIDIPKGSYVPAFERVHPGEAPVVERHVERQAIPSDAPKILVTPFEAECDQAAFPNLTRGFTRQVVAGLTRFSDLTVLGSDTTFSYAGISQPEREAVEQQVDFIVTGGCAIASGRFSVEALLIDTRSKHVIWGETFDRELRPNNIIEVRDELANCIVRALAQSYGVIFTRKAREIEGRPPGQLRSYECVVRFHQYWRAFDPEMHADVRACLERTIVQDPEYAEAFVCLSQICCDAYRFNFVPEDEHAAMLERSVELAQRAIALAPRSGRGHHALAMAYWFTGDVRSSLEEFETALGLNPNATEVMADLGQRYAILADWDKAIPLLTESYRRNPAQPGTYRIGFFLYHFAHDRYAEALSEARKVNAPHLVFQYIAEAVALVGLGRRKEAAPCIAKIGEIDARYLDRAGEDLLRRHVAPELAAKIIRMLRLAGAPVQIKAIESG